jgi:signal transduction histidine kinase
VAYLQGKNNIVKRKSFFLLIGVWIIVIIGSFIYNYTSIVKSNKAIILNESKAFFDQIVTTRTWNSMHGGVYVLVTENNQPNPYLNDYQRDIVSTEGLELTKVNPAYMTRQIAEIAAESHQRQFKITSLNPIRPGNKPDQWEENALSSFETGMPFVFELVDSVGQYRYMAPLLTEHSCLNCHAIQGYEFGDVRGGISVSTPDNYYKAAINSQVMNMAFFHLMVFLFGIVGLLFFYKQVNRLFSIIKNKNTELLSLNATKDKLFSIIAHDLKGPVSSIQGLSSLMMEDSNSSETSDADLYIRGINSAAENTYNLLDNLLVWARTQTGKIEFAPEALNLKHIIKEVIDLYKSAAVAKNIAIEYPHTEGIEIHADKNMILTVLRNLLSNAIKFSNPKGVVKIMINSDKAFVFVTVSDHGVGIAENVLKKLFDPGNTFSTKGTLKEEGTGLGLVICKEFVEKHGGEIWVKSEQGKGSDFTFSLPK